jgi:hypothetical protein
MHAWFAAFVDTRYSVTVPIIGVQVLLFCIKFIDMDTAHNFMMCCVKLYPFYDSRDSDGPLIITCGKLE